MASLSARDPSLTERIATIDAESRPLSGSILDARNDPRPKVILRDVVIKAELRHVERFRREPDRF